MSVQSDFQEKVSACFRPWQRSFQFWVRAVDIYTGYKVFQLRVGFEKNAQKQEAMWERQHEVAAEKIYNMCSDLGGFFLKVAQLIGKPDLAPAAWVRRLVTLCDQAPATPYNVIRAVLEKELDQNLDELFESFDVDPLGSASIAQVHRARLKGDKKDVVVKVQHPGVQELMMTDIHNLQAFALYLQKIDIKFDIYSLTKEIEKQVHKISVYALFTLIIYCFSLARRRMGKKDMGRSSNTLSIKIGYEFNFLREADAMDRIRRFLYENNRKSPVMVPRVIRDIVTRRVLVMEYIDGTPILKLGDEMAKRGISPDGKIAAVARQNILKSLSLAYGQMILRSGFFHADPHPGNILICKGAEASMHLSFSSFNQVALLDYGQVKDLPKNLRLGYANLILAIADGDATRARESFKELGIGTLSKCEDEQKEMLKLARGMFDTKLPPGVKMLQPFSEESSVKKIAVEAFPEELFSILRTLQILRGLSVGLGISHSCAEQWRPIAEEALYNAGRVTDIDMKRSHRHRARRKSGK
ncbi:hypothetical protein RDI58_017401 [Solanum bulbocastanum]|uniref:ABC1 atypical kinase-like domain-containing protein n=1 Tax=Solanum bulbocastanum TaxID=147425 RepID=A0AAN8TEY3_SOLBU